MFTLSKKSRDSIQSLSKHIGHSHNLKKQFQSSYGTTKESRDKAILKKNNQAGSKILLHFKDTTRLK